MAPRGATTGIKYSLSNQSLCGSLSLLHPSSHMQRAVGVMSDYLYVRDILSIIHMVLVWFECLSTQLVRIELAKRRAHALIRQAKYPKEFPEKRARLCDFTDHTSLLPLSGLCLVAGRKQREGNLKV